MKKQTMRTLSALTAGVMLLGILSGCTKPGNPQGGTPAPSTSTPPATTLTYPVQPEELGSGTVKWAETKTADGWMEVTNEGGSTLGYSPDSGVKLIQYEGLAFKDLNKNNMLDEYEDWRQSADARAADLASQLSVDEIAGMMIHYSQFNVTDEPAEMKDPMDQGIRFILSFATAHPVDVQAKWNNNMQALAEGSAHGVPVGISTNPRTTPVWPDNLGLAATFDPDVVFEASKGMSKEYRALGISTLLGPQIDLATDPRWSRIGGTFGEDPALSRDMTAASVNGHQSTFDESGKDLGWGKDSVNAMIKHWPGDGTGESGRESHDWFGQYAVYPGGQFETSLIPFVDGGLTPGGATDSATAVMDSYSVAWSEDEEYGELVGSAFSKYKNDLLRSYGFDGVICSDWGIIGWDIMGMVMDTGWGVQGVERGERSYKAIQAGIDQIGGFNDPEPIRQAYDLLKTDEGEEAATKRFQDSARRLMKNSFIVGIFENPYVDVAHAKEIVGGTEMRAAGYDAQLKSIVMLKNEGNVISSDNAKKTEKPTVYIPYVWAPASQSALGASPASWSLPVDLKQASEFFNVVTDKVPDTLTGPADKDGKPTFDFKDIIRAGKAELADCDYSLVFVKSPQNISHGMTSTGYDKGTESFVPNSLQYGEYTADSQAVRSESLSGSMVEKEVTGVYGTQKVNEKENRSYFGKTAMLSNASDLDTILYAVNNVPESAKVIVAIDAKNPTIVSEFESQVDAILMGFAMDKKTILDIVAGQHEPSGLLPFQMPKDMETVEANLEDVPRDLECYTDAAGNTYDFAYGMNWSGVIKDARTEKYGAAPLVTPVNQPK